MTDTVVIEGEVSLVNQVEGEVELVNQVDGEGNVVINIGGGSQYDHYTGSYEVTPSTSAQTLETEGLVMDNDVSISAVAEGSATTPATIITANPTLSRSGRVVTATVSKTQQVTPTVVEGYVSSGTAGNIGVSGSDTLTIPEGSATTPATSVTANPSISVSSAGVITATVSKSESVTPTVVEGYVSSGTAGTVSVSGSATENLTTQGATTYHVSSSDQSIASGKYLTGTQTIQKVVVDGLTADKIVNGHTVKIGDVDDDDRIVSVTGTASGGITPTGTKTITANGTNIDVYNYQYADVAVPNSYSASDEGKVVSNGALVAQTSDTVTANDTYDTTLINSLTVNVSGGGGSALELLEEITLSEAVHSYDIDFSQYITDGYNTIYGYVDLTLSSSDYIYYGVKKSGVNNVYVNSWVGTRATDAAWRFSWGKMADGSNYSAANTGATFESNISVFRVWAYAGSVNIVAGSKIRIYGVKYSI